MLQSIARYTHWLHGRWPAGKPEKMPLVNPDGTTNVAGLYVVGDLTGVPLLKFSSDTGAKAVRHLANAAAFAQRKAADGVVDVAIVGGGVSGYAAALEAKKLGLSFALIEASEPFSTIANFPKAKPIYTYPSELTPDSELRFEGDVSVKERLLADLQRQAQAGGIEPLIAEVSHVQRTGPWLEAVIPDGERVRAHRVIVAIGRAGKYRQLDVPGFQSDKVANRLHDPAGYAGKRLLVVGGGDSAVEAAIATAEAGAEVTLSYRGDALHRPKAANVEQIQALHEAGKLRLALGTELAAVEPDQVQLTDRSGARHAHANDFVLAMLGREAPLDFFRRSGVAISGESTPLGWMAFGALLLFCIALYDWKGYGFLESVWRQAPWPYLTDQWLADLSGWWADQIVDRSGFLGVIATSMKGRSFYYTLLYTSLVGYFGWRRVQRRKTPYVTRQTWTLFLIQAFPLFLLPELFLPWMGYQGWFDAGAGRVIADQLFPSYISLEDLAAHHWPEWGHPRAYWHAYGFILAWPLSVWNAFSTHPMTGGPMVTWLVISFVQTFVLIPWMVLRWGKGAYCGWICSCGALAETMGDTQRHKMPHGSGWNRLNMLGQVLLALAFVMLAMRIGAWIAPESWMGQQFTWWLEGKNGAGTTVNPASWKWIVDILLGGILGVGLYFKFSGRMWCRFACPLAALMHIYARFSRFRIFAEKDKCISCNACTSVCHQGIDVMAFANKGLPMEDPQCVRCSACVQTCPTGVLRFGQIDPVTREVKVLDSLPASPVQMAERAGDGARAS
ncbi:MAG: NAD(P)-binding domain-containing protein [Pseudomonadota bacterium]